MDNNMSTISTHVLDTVLGKPAAGISVQLEERRDGVWTPLASASTDSDGRCRDLTQNLLNGMYRLTFCSGDYLARLGRQSIYPEISITFTLSGEPHYHLPLLLSDNSYTTYRGS
jgi:5-hydroxyisourate hydrolase